MLKNSKTQLFEFGRPRKFPGTADEVAFPLGGIGTGTISLGARGQFKDWEIFNRPGKGRNMPYTFFSLWFQQGAKHPIARVLESRINPPYNQAQGLLPWTTAGLPRLKSSEFTGEYPLARVKFIDDTLPLDIQLEAYTPFIPHNPEDSGLPGIIMKYKIKNKSDEKITLSIAGSIFNPVGYCGEENLGNQNNHLGGNINIFSEQKDFSGLFLKSNKYEDHELRAGNISLVTTGRNIIRKTNWTRGLWFEPLSDFWKDFSEDGFLEELIYETPSNDGESDVGSVGSRFELDPGQESVVTFILTWYFPNRIYGWKQSCDYKYKLIKNHYAIKFDNSWAVAQYINDNLLTLEKNTYMFHEAFFKSTFPGYILDAVSSQISTIRSNTCIWLENNAFMGYEGCNDDEGSCPMDTSHVWNYEQTLAFLFPSLERKMRENDFKYKLDEKGFMQFRTMLPLGEKWEEKPWSDKYAADGLFGTIIRLYRDYLISGDINFLTLLWDRAKLAFEYAIKHWDKDERGVLEGEQHCTFDIDFYGVNSLTGLFYLGALKAMAIMSKIMGDFNNFERYNNTYDNGSKTIDEMLWNGEYYIQKLNNTQEFKNQYESGCLSDQLVGQWLSTIAGLGDLLSDEHIRTALHSIFKYNFKSDFSDFENCYRSFVLNEEKGLVVCTWPREKKPEHPFPYCTEVFTGTEYQVASHLISKGYLREGLTIVKALRDRFDGYKRNPWNENECGHHYVRAMSSWALLLSLSGFQYNLAEGWIEFNPLISTQDFVSFWSIGDAWGVYEQKEDNESANVSAVFKILYGKLPNVAVRTKGIVDPVKVEMISK